jgi:hypothetical protein
MVHSIVINFEKIWLSHTLNVILKPKRFLFSKRKRAVGKVNVNYTVIKLDLYFMVHSNVWKFEKIWLSGTLIIIRKPKKSLFSNRKRAIWTVNLKYTIIELNLHSMVHTIVLNFENIWLSHTLIIIRKPKKSYFLKEKGPEPRNGKCEIHHNWT